MTFPVDTRIRRFVRLLTAVFLLIGGLSGVGLAPAFAQNTIGTIQIVDVNTANFPEVVIQARVLGPEGLPIQTLAEDTLMLTENDQQVPYEYRSVDAGIQLALVADLGAGSGAPGATGAPRAEEIKLLMQQYIDGMGENDTAMLVVQNQAGIQIAQPLTADKDALRAAIDSLSANDTDTLTNGPASINQALNSLAEVSGIDRAQAVLFFSTGLQSSTPVSVDNTLALAGEYGIPVYTVLANDSGAEAVSAGLSRLAAESGGLYAHYQQDNSLNPILAILVQQRIQWQFTYRSALSSSGERTIALETRGGGPNTPRDFRSYGVELSPPQIFFDVPEPGAVIVRRADSFNQDIDTVAPTTTIVSVHVEWPDGQNPRNIQSAQLFVDGDEYGSPVLSPGNTINFSWGLQVYRNIGQNNARLQVQVIDELGFSALSNPMNVTIIVEYPDQPAAVCTSRRGLDYILCAIREDTVGLIALIITIPTLLLALVAWRNRGTLSEAVARSSEAMTQFVARVTRPATEIRDAAAFLTVLRGDPLLTGRHFPVYANTVTPIGRDKSQVEIVFPDEENSVVSRKHCEIRQEDGQFKLRDFASTYGTFLNGVKLPELAIEDLHHGDEIGLGPVERGGVLLRFELILNENNMPEEFRDTQPA